MKLDLRLLVPGASGDTVLLDAGGGLPQATVDGDEDVAAIVAVDELLRSSWALPSAVLETHPRWKDAPEGGPIPTLVTTEAAPVDWRPPDGLAFGPIPVDLPELPVAIRPRAVELAEELRSGAPPPPLRPRWARPGWNARAVAWMRRAAAEAGRPLIGEPRPFYLRGISALLRAPTADGDLFLKAVFPVFHAEPVITRVLADRLPDDVPPVLAIEPEEGWLLVGDIGSRWVLELPEAERPAALAEGARTLVEIQRAMAGQPHDLAALEAAGSPHRPLDGIPAAFAAAIGVDGFGAGEEPVPEADRDIAIARVRAAVERLARLGLPESLIHGDFHSGNAARVDDGRIVIIDWSDAAIGSPLVDLVTWTSWSGERGEEIDAATDAWIDAWSPVVPAARLRDHVADILVAGAAYQVIS
ncbi:MAG TPA: phosphotransferase, partial [Candidatus Limnocylindrales bacterium]